MKYIYLILQSSLDFIMGIACTISLVYQLYLIGYIKPWNNTTFSAMWIVTLLYCISMPIISWEIISQIIISYINCKLLRIANYIKIHWSIAIFVSISCLPCHLILSLLLFSNAQSECFSFFDYFLLSGVISSTLVLIYTIIYSVVKLFKSIRTPNNHYL